MDKISVVPEKETNSLRDKVKAAIENAPFKNGDLKYHIADAIFDALGIKSADQDKVGAKVVVESPRRSYIVDLQSFRVDAHSLEEAQKVAQTAIVSRYFNAQIENIEEYDYSICRAS